MTHRILMLVGSDPDSDPRIEWEATYAPDKMQVTAMGACTLPLRGPEREQREHYEVLRVVRDGRGYWPFFAAAMTLMIPWTLRPALLVLLLPLAICGAVLEGLRRFAKACIGRTRFYESLRVGGRFLLTLCGLRIPAGFFRHVVTASAAFWRGICGESPDERTIVHCNDLDTLLVGVMAKRRFGCKLVYDCHEFMPHAWADATRWNTWLLRLYEGWLIGNADSVITVNPLLAGAMMSAYSGTSVQSVPNAAPLPRTTQPAVNQSPAIASPGFRPLRFIFQGGFGFGRGIEELILAWRSIDPAQAILLLRGPDHAHKRQCMALAESLGLKDVSVFFPTPVTEDHLIEAAAEGDVGVIPYKPTIINFLYCCPNKLSQYMQAGLPILAGDTRYVRQLLAESGAGICYDPADETSIVAAVKHYVRDELFRQRCRENGARFVREKFHWQAQSKPLYDAYQRLATASNVGWTSSPSMSSVDGLEAHPTTRDGLEVHPTA